MTSCAQCFWELAAGRWVLHECVSLHHLMSHKWEGRDPERQPPTSLQGYDRVQTGLNIHCVLGELPNVCMSAWLLLVGVNTFFHAWFLFSAFQQSLNSLLCWVVWGFFSLSFP